MNRRGFLAGLLATVAAPALVRGAAPAAPQLMWWMGQSGFYIYNDEITDVMRSQIVPLKSLNSFIIDEKDLAL